MTQTSIPATLAPLAAAPTSATRAAAAAPQRGDIRLRNVTKKYGATMALDDINLEIPSGSLTVIVGPSGCGKWTLLKPLSGLEQATAGQVMIGDNNVTEYAVGTRDLGMVFQDYALYPHMTVERNIGFGLMLQSRHDRSAGLNAAIIRQRVLEVARMLGMEDLLKRKPAQLSGGQRQRTALARAIIRRPSVLLLDEPLSALDAQLRTSARAEILRLYQEIGSTLVLVTHDQAEALSMATHLVVLKDGRVAQSGTPEELYQRPVNEFVAGFVGLPAMNIHAVPGLSNRVGWRPSDGLILDDAGSDFGGGNMGRGTGSAAASVTVTGVVEASEFTGEGRLLLCRTMDGDRFSVAQPATGHGLLPGATISVRIPHDRLHHFDIHGNRTEASFVHA